MNWAFSGGWNESVGREVLYIVSTLASRRTVCVKQSIASSLCFSSDEARTRRNLWFAALRAGIRNNWNPVYHTLPSRNRDGFATFSFQWTKQLNQRKFEKLFGGVPVRVFLFA